MFSWIAICAGIAIIVPQLCLGMVVFWNQGYVAQPWHAFLIYQAINVLVLVYNMYLLRRTMWIHDLACKLFLTINIIRIWLLTAVNQQSLFRFRVS